jgi:hypothetical protein
MTGAREHRQRPTPRSDAPGLIVHIEQDQRGMGDLAGHREVAAVWVMHHRRTADRVDMHP